MGIAPFGYSRNYRYINLFNLTKMYLATKNVIAKNAYLHVLRNRQKTAGIGAAVKGLFKGVFGGKRAIPKGLFGEATNVMRAARKEGITYKRPVGLDPFHQALSDANRDFNGAVFRLRLGNVAHRNRFGSTAVRQLLEDANALMRQSKNKRQNIINTYSQKQV